MKKLTGDQKKGLIGTVIFHLLLLLLLAVLALRTPLPLPGEEGVEVNLGYDEQGVGQKQADHAKPKKNVPEKIPAKTEKVREKETRQQPEPQKKADENLTQDVEEAPALKEKKKEKKEKKKDVHPVKEQKKEPVNKVEEKKEKIPPKPVINERALFKGSSKKTKGENQGAKNGVGDQGKPHGYKESSRYEGTGGQGNGIAYSLGGRGSKYLEKPSVKVTETGTVVVSIWVNPDGKVVRAAVRQKGTTVLDQNLRRMAVEAALNSVFEKDPTAPPEQRGTITYQFILLK